jgi:hypothetical protein
MAEHEAACGLVDREERAADRVFLLRVIPADRGLVEKPGEPPRTASRER